MENPTVSFFLRGRLKKKVPGDFSKMAESCSRDRDSAKMAFWRIWLGPSLSKVKAPSNFAQSDEIIFASFLTTFIFLSFFLPGPSRRKRFLAKFGPILFRSELAI